MKRALHALLLLATPVLAQDRPNLDATAPAMPGAVALYLSATALYDQGVAAKDPLMVLTAARMMRGLAVTPAPRSPEPPAEAAPPAMPALDPATMFDMARQLDAGDSYGDLIEVLSRETPPPPKALRASVSQLDPGAAVTWTLPFFGGTYAELAVLGAHTGNLDLAVSDAGGQIICTDNGAADTAYCGFVPLENGDFTVTVTNSGATPDAYMLATN